MLGASFTGCIENDLEELEENNLENALYTLFEDLENGKWESFCKMLLFEIEDDTIILADKTQIKECAEDDDIFGGIQVKYTVNNYKEEKTDDTLASNSGPIYEVTLDLEICVRYDSADPWNCETEEETSYFTKVSGQWIDVTDYFEQGESAPIVVFWVEQDSANVYHVEVIKVTKQEDLAEFSFFLKDGSGSTYVGGNGFGEIAMQWQAGDVHGIETYYGGDDEALQNRANYISNDDGSDFPVHFSDNDRDGKLSAGDQFLVYGDPGPATDGWKLDIQFDATGDIVGSAKLGEFEPEEEIEVVLALDGITNNIYNERAQEVVVVSVTQDIDNDQLSTFVHDLNGNYVHSGFINESRAEEGYYHVIFYDNDRSGKLSPGDKFVVYMKEDEREFELRLWSGGTVGFVIIPGYTVEQNTIKIGFLNPITGPLEPDAPGFKWGADEAANDLTAMYASDNVQFEIIEVDSGCSGDVAASAAQTLVDSGVVAVVGAACSGASMGANAVLSQYGIPMISYASSNPGLSDDSAYPHFYRVVPSDAIQGPAGADMMADAGVTNESLAILHMTNDYGSGLADSIKVAWEAEGRLCGAGMQGYEETTTDFSAAVQAIMDNTDCEAVYLSSYITDAAMIIEELADQGFTGKIFGGDGPAGYGLFERFVDNATADGFTVSAPRAGTSYGDFEARYDANAAEVGSIKFYVLTAYDTTMIVGQAAMATGTISEGIESVGTNYEGASGLITFLGNGDGTGAGYDICTYGGDDYKGTYTCSKYWTADEGIQEY